MLSKSCIGSPLLEAPDKSNTSPVVSAHLTSLTLPGKPESVVSFTSQCSYSSTLVHVGDKKPQPELGTVLLLWDGILLYSFYRAPVTLSTRITMYSS